MKIPNKKWLTTGGALAAFLASTAVTHADNYEYQYSEGYHEEEWYDPSDWFDDEQWGYDSHAVDYENDTTGDWAFWDNDGLWEDDYDYDYTTGDDSSYGSYYSWNDQTNSWERNYGSYESEYDYDPASYMIVYTTSRNANDQANSSQRDSNRNYNSQRDNNRNNNNQARSSQRDNTRNWEEKSRDSRQQNKEFSQSTLKGEIVGFRHMELKVKNDQKREYTITRVDLDNGQTVAINLGEKERLDSLKLESGDDVKVKGVLGKLNGEPLFIANQLMVNNRTFDVNRAFDSLNKMDRQNQNKMDRQNQSSQNRSDQMTGNTQGQSRVQGTVDGFTSTRIQGSDENRTLARLLLENGRSITVDLGDVASVRSLDINQGDEIRVQGEIKRIEGRKILSADRIWINGDKVQSFSYNY